jgi:integrase/recombinase XerD
MIEPAVTRADEVFGTRNADLTTTNRYAEITTKAKIEALRNTEPATASEGTRPRPIWRSDQALLDWLSSL